MHVFPMHAPPIPHPKPAKAPRLLLEYLTAFINTLVHAHPLHFLDGKSHANGRLILDIVCHSHCLRKRNHLKVPPHGERLDLNRDEVMPVFLTLCLKGSDPHIVTSTVFSWAKIGIASSEKKEYPQLVVKSETLLNIDRKT